VSVCTKELYISRASNALTQINILGHPAILTIFRKFLLMAFLASGLFITNRATPEKKKKKQRKEGRKK